MYNYYVTPGEYEIAKRNGIPEKTVNNRVRSLGWDKNRAITQPLRKFNTDIVKLAKSNGISYQMYYWRVNKLGWDPVKAATTPKIPTGQQARIFPKECTDKAKELGMYQNFLYRVNHGWDPEKACSIPPLSKSESRKLSKNSELREFFLKS